MSQINARLVYKNAVRSMVKAGVDPSKAILSQSYLRFERVASTSVTNYQFGVLLNDVPQGSTVRPLENRLQLQDAFYVSQIQFFICLADSATATDYQNSTYPNPNIFTGAGVAQGLYNAYNGQMSLTVNNRQICVSWDLVRHLSKEQTQQNATLASGVNQDQFNGGSSGSFVAEPNWVLIGSKNNQLSIQLPSAIPALTATKTTVLAIVMRGVLAQNCTVVS